jgi:hypothetical protein
MIHCAFVASRVKLYPHAPALWVAATMGAAPQGVGQGVQPQPFKERRAHTADLKRGRRKSD